MWNFNTRILINGELVWDALGIFSKQKEQATICQNILCSHHSLDLSCLSWVLDINLFTFEVTIKHNNYTTFERTNTINDLP